MKTAMNIHPIADCYPQMTKEDYERLRDDIKAHGVRIKIVFLGESLDDCVLIDGRHRFKAVNELGLDWRDHARLLSAEDVPDVKAFIRSVNDHRRHYTTGQLAMIANRIATLEAHRPEATTSNKIHGELTAEISAVKKQAESQTTAAKELGVSRGSVQLAKVVATKGVLGLQRAVDSGAVTVAAAAEIVDLPKDEQIKLVKAGPKAIKEKAAAIRKAKKPKPAKHDEPASITKEDSGSLEPVSQFDPEVIEGTTTTDDEPDMTPLKAKFDEGQSSAALAQWVIDQEDLEVVHIGCAAWLQWLEDMKPSKRFVKPTVEQVRDHCRVNGINNVDAENFVNFYESKGWLVGKSPMKNWQASVRTWEKGDKHGTGTAAGHARVQGRNVTTDDNADATQRAMESARRVV